jgi:dTMP kinase
MALFITFEGGEGGGKSLQARALYQQLAHKGIPSVLTHEPGGTSLGNRLARLLKWAEETKISPLTELLLFNTSRAQLVDEIIRPNLQQGTVVICDRYTDSTVAYQSYGRGLELPLVRAVNDAATQGLKPDLSVLLDMPVEEGLARKRKGKRDRFEKENLSFHQGVRQGYLKMAAEEPERWLVVDAEKPKAEIKRLIWEKVSQLLSITDR